MDSKKAVMVLAPNGRRQTVKVTPNTTILQILEEVCKKQGLKPEAYDIKHHNKCLDISTIIRFSGLPNNAQLELAEATKIRSEGIVTVGIQLEDGSRLTDTFTPNSSLWEVLLKICPEEANPETNPVVIYMRREMYGRDLFEDTTLRSLGLTGGRAMLRIIHRTPEELRTQANVSAPLPSLPVEEKPYIRVLKKSDSPPEPPMPQEPTSSKPQNSTPVNEEQDAKPATSSKKQENFLTQFIKQEKQKTEENPKKAVKRFAESQQDAITHDVESEKEKTVAEEDFVFLGTRNAMIFSQETAQAVPSEELPDDFFELTISDAKKLLKDIKKRRLDMENAPLQTSVLRNLEQSKQQLTNLNRYKQSVIRINFPDHTVLQGTFSPVDTVGTVLEFVRDYLENDKMEFYLYTAPPKNILNNDSRLVEIGCVPNALLHFGTKVLTKDETYLRKDLLSKFTSASLASLAAAKFRQEATRPALPNDEDDIDIDNPDVNVGASTSAAPTYEDYPARNPPSPKNVPKWFKPTK